MRWYEHKQGGSPYCPDCKRFTDSCICGQSWDYYCGAGECPEGWHLGPPPIADDGALVIVIVGEQSEDETFTGPVIVRRYNGKMKTTCGTRIEYDEVFAWYEWNLLGP